MTKRERKAKQRLNRRTRRFVSWCLRVSRESEREAYHAEIWRRRDAVLAEIAGEWAEHDRATINRGKGDQQRSVECTRSL